MLQYPTNFYPENVAIDVNAENNIEFTFNGDFLTAVTFRTINYMTEDRLTAIVSLRIKFRAGTTATEFW